jgi:hypothetical protein
MGPASVRAPRWLAWTLTVLSWSSNSVGINAILVPVMGVMQESLAPLQLPRSTVDNFVSQVYVASAAVGECAGPIVAGCFETLAQHFDAGGIGDTAEAYGVWAVLVLGLAAAGYWVTRPGPSVRARERERERAENA